MKGKEGLIFFHFKKNKNLEACGAWVFFFLHFLLLFYYLEVFFVTFCLFWKGKVGHEFFLSFFLFLNLGSGCGFSFSHFFIFLILEGERGAWVYYYYYYYLKFYICKGEGRRAWVYLFIYYLLFYFYFILLSHFYLLKGGGWHGL